MCGAMAYCMNQLRATDIPSLLLEAYKKSTTSPSIHTSILAENWMLSKHALGKRHWQDTSYAVIVLDCRGTSFR